MLRASEMSSNFATNDYVPDIKTKCGSEKPVLLSWKLLRKAKTEDDKGNLLAPNIVHYVQFGSSKFSLLNYLSFVSVDLYIKPTFIFLHGDVVPRGEWWEKTIREIPNIYYVFRQRPVRIQNSKARWIQHSSDVLRLQVILGKNYIQIIGYHR